MTWRPNEDYSGQELQKIWPYLVHYTRGRVLDVGSGQVRLFSHWITLDSGKDYGGKRIADIMANGENEIPFPPDSLDAIVSSHFIEHCKGDWTSALGLWWSKIKVGGNLVLYWPHPDYYPKVGEPGANPDHTHNIYPDQVLGLFKAKAGGWDLLENETRIEGNEYSQFMVFRKRGDDQQIERPWRRHEKSVLVVRYGAFGDALLASSILPELKAQGWHITFNAEAASASVIAHDPHIDAWILNDKDQVPNTNLAQYWAGLAKRYDRVIQLNESVENTTLALPGSAKDNWPAELRRKMLNVNYMEFTHDLAEVPHNFHQRFYARDDEKKLALEQRKELIGDRPLIGWVLRGSSVHKVWPYVRAVVARLIFKTDACVMLLGDKSCLDFEKAILTYVAELCGKEALKRVWVTCGTFPIRASMVFATHGVDVLVGPETGVLNAAALEPVQKVIFLSHSTQENLTKHWVNYRVLEAFPACRPCHQLHYGWDRCKKDEGTQTALCQSMIDPDMAEAAIMAALTDAIEAKKLLAEMRERYGLKEDVKPEDDSGLRAVAATAAE